MQDLDVLERDAQLVRDDLRERRLVALAVGGGTGGDLDLAGGEHPDARGLPAAGAVVQRAEHTGRARPHISVKVEMPMPSWTGSLFLRRSSCSRRRPA